MARFIPSNLDPETKNLLDNPRAEATIRFFQIVRHRRFEPLLRAGASVVDL